MKYKLICIDMDGTLLDDNHNISDENYKAIKEAQKKGIIVVLCTGRLLNSAKHYAEELGINDPIIASNGTFIVGKNETEILFKESFSLEESIMIYKMLEKYNINTYYFNTFDSVISKKPFPKDHPYGITNAKAKAKNKIKLLMNEDLELLIREHSSEILKAIAIEKDDINKIMKAKEAIKKLGIFEVVSSSSNNFEIMKKGSSKGNAVKTLANLLGIKREEIVCIGDNENDISMIKYAGFGVAMGNACDGLKKEAKYITDSNNNSGVGKVILQII